MKRWVLVLIVSFLCCSVFSQDNVNEWITIKEQEKGYRIDFPSSPKEEKQDVSTIKGSVVMNSYSSQPLNSSNIIYMSSFTQYPSSFFPDSLDTFEKRSNVLDGSVNGAVNNTKGKLMLDQKISFNGYDGRFVKILINGDYVISMKTILVGFRLYIIQTIAKLGIEDNKEAKRFFNSFELINVKQ